MKIIKKLKNGYVDMSKPAKASLWFIICYIIQRGLQFIGMPIFTRIMSPDEYGIYSVFLSWFNLICVFSSLSIYNGTFNKAMIKYENQRNQYISSVQCLTGVISFIFCLLIIILNKFIYRWTGYSLKFQVLFCIHISFFPIFQYWSQKQRFLFEYKKLVFVTIFHSAATLLLGILFVFISAEKSFSLITVTVGVQAVINMGLFVSIFAKGKCLYHKEYWKWSMITALPLIPHYLSEILLGHADRLMIRQICGAAEAGIYNIVYQISMVMTILRTGINGSFTPWLYYALKKKEYSDIKRVTKMISLFMWILTVFFILIGPEILRLVAPVSYYAAVVDIPAIMVGCFFIFVYVLFLNVEIYYEQNQYVAFASGVSAVLNIVLNFICIRKFGYLAAGYTTMISYLVMAVMHYLFLKNIISAHQELKSVFDFKFILIASLMLIIISIGAIPIYQYVWIRWFIIALIIICIFYKKDTLVKTLKILKRRS